MYICVFCMKTRYSNEITVSCLTMQAAQIIIYALALVLLKRLCPQGLRTRCIVWPPALFISWASHGSMGTAVRLNAQTLCVHLSQHQPVIF